MADKLFETVTLRLNPEKCEIFKSGLLYLGHMVTRDGIHTDPGKISAVKNLQPPTNLKQLRSVLGMASYYRRFVPDFTEISQPLTVLLTKGKHWVWGEAQLQAFNELKRRLTEAPVLACPDFDKPFTLQTDASDYGLGGVLTQEVDGKERVIAYASRGLNKAEKNYSATEKECLAIVWGIRKMRPYLERYHFKVVTDHLSLKWLKSIENPTGRIARWALELQQYSFDIEYRKGKLNVVADALSRQPEARLQQLSAIKNQEDWVQRKMQDPAKFPDYAVVEGRLYRHFQERLPNDDQPQWKLCVPVDLRQQVLSECHDKPSAGHLGIRKTTARVMQKYYWPGLMRDVSRYVKACQSCQLYKVSQQAPAGEMLSRIAQHPWEVLCADFVGPLPRSKRGHTMLLVLTDKFSKWVELIPLRRATSATLQKSIRENILSRFGCPKVLITDNGTQFTSKDFHKFLKEMGIHQQFTAPYTPQENPTERANRTVKTIIAQVTGKDHQKWDESLPEIMLAINSSISETTNYTPAFLMQGRELRLPGLLYDTNILGNGRAEENTVDKAKRIEEVFEITRRNLAKAASNQANYYNLRRRKWHPEIGQQVLAKEHPLSKAADKFAAKLAPKYSGPYTVWRYKSPVIVEIKSKEGKIRVAHIGDLKQFFESSTSTAHIQ